MPYILILYYSKKGTTASMARHIAKGIDQFSEIEAKIRTVPSLVDSSTISSNNVPKEGPLYATIDDVRNCSGIILGSPAYFGSMASSLKYFIDTLTPVWIEGSLIDKPAAVFTSASSLHGGQESTLLHMAAVLLHQGVCFLGLPYSEQALSTTRSGGTPYGPSHFSGEKHQFEISKEEKQLCFKVGQRIASFALKFQAEK